MPPITVPSAQDLKRIRQIDAETEAGLNKLGVHRYEQIAAWMQPDVKRIGEALGLADRINRENWIEQAQVLAKGGVTHYAMRVARGEVANAEPTPDEGEPGAIAAGRGELTGPDHAARVDGRCRRRGRRGGDGRPAPGLPPTMPVALAASPDVSERAAFAAPRRETPAPTPQAASAPMPAPAVPVRPAAPAARDNLQRISGIDAEAEKLLIAQGVTRYSQMAHWSPAEVERFDAAARRDRAHRPRELDRAGADPEPGRRHGLFARLRSARARRAQCPLRPAKLADAIREHSGKGSAMQPPAAQTDLARCDRSAPRPTRTRSRARKPPSAPPRRARCCARPPLDDLKRIRGIGVLIEKKLNQMGVVAYEQIANWTAEDVDRVSQSLDFKGRIERENWVEQARILASGGATEFSRRVDRGEVETSRYRP